MGFKGAKMKREFKKLQSGMNKQDVLELLGKPDSREGIDDGGEILAWHSNEFKGWLRGGFIERTISIKFKNDIVIDISQKNIDCLAF